MKELNEKLQQQENELKETKEKFAAYRDEMSDTEVRIESLTLDLEMAEEKVKLETKTISFDLERSALHGDCSLKQSTKKTHNSKRNSKKLNSNWMSSKARFN